MKQLKSITLIALIVMGWALHANAQDNQEPKKLSDEQKRFDLDGNGALSDEENDLMLRVGSIEALTGNKLTDEEIKRMHDDQGPDMGFGGPPGGMPGFGFGGGRGGRRGPQPAEKLVKQFDTDKDGKLTGAERQEALNTRGGGTVSLMSEENLREGCSERCAGKSQYGARRFTCTLQRTHTPYTLSPIPPRRLVRADEFVLPDSILKFQQN